MTYTNFDSRLKGSLALPPERWAAIQKLSAERPRGKRRRKSRAEAQAA